MDNIINLIDETYIYIPYKEGTLNVNNGDYIYKEDLIINNNKKVFSPVSGTILGLTTLNNKNILLLKMIIKKRLVRDLVLKNILINITKKN